MHPVSTGIIIVAFLCTFAGVLCYAEGDLVIAECHLEPNRKPPAGESSSVKGVIKIIQAAAGEMTHFVVNLTKVGAPFQPHGFHIHQYGDIYSQGCQSAGGHYNPFGFTHGGPDDNIRHVGDLGNLVTDADGNISAELEDNEVSLVGTHSVIGRAFVIHAKRDDLGRGVGPAREESKKTGNAGARLGCGIIFLASPAKP